ncbi:MAG: hypothetical protein C4582_11630 [Desulfobacteraceae bacterium]|nr:MAG: hypothetical protein C4582_11630 [Desulfobacteraceae bacterium]
MAINDFIAVMNHLIDLQECDAAIRALERRMDVGPLRIKTLQEELTGVEQKLDEELLEIDACLKEKKLIEQEIADLDRQVEKSNDKLSQIKSNKEYKAGLKEIDDLKWNKTQLEEKLLSVLEKLEQLTPKKTVHESKKKKLRTAFEKEQAEIMKDLESVKISLQELSEKRSKVSEIIEKDLLGHYNLLRTRKGGIAVSPVVKGVCQSCHMGIPPQQFNELIRGERLMNCPNCKRIIYWGDDARLQKQPGGNEVGVSE